MKNHGFFAMENAAGVFQCSTVKLPERGLSTGWIVAVTTWNPSSNQPVAMVVKPGRAQNPYRTNSWNWGNHHGYFWLGLKHTGWFTLHVREKCVAPVATWWTKTYCSHLGLIVQHIVNHPISSSFLL